MTQLNEENLLSRWSRRKRQSVQETRIEDLQVDLQRQNLSASEIANIKANEAEEKEPVDLLTDDDMPPIESLNEDSDFSGFMSSGVSDELRNLALRKLFKAASFNVCDGLDEYDEDYTSFEKLGDLVTCDMKYQIELEAKKKLQEEADKLAESEPGELSCETSVEQATTKDIDGSNKIETEQLVSETTRQHQQDACETPVMNTADSNE